MLRNNALSQNRPRERSGTATSLPSPSPSMSVPTYQSPGYGNTAPCMACSLRNQARIFGPTQGGMMRPDLSIFNQLAQVTDYLYLSGARAVNFTRIVERGITCVVNATIELPNLPMPNVEYVKVPVDDTPYSNLSSYFDLVADKIAETRRRGGKTLVHCIAGVSRSASLCIAYLMKYEGMSLRKAYQHVKARRPIAHPNHGFFKQLIDYERRIFGHESVKMVNSAAGLIPDVYEEEYRNIMWVTTYKSDFGGGGLTSH